jgi:hypothetical protein
LSFLSCSEVVSLVKERFGVPVRSSILRFLILLTRGVRAPMTSISSTSAIPSQVGNPPFLTAGAGVLSACEVAAGVVEAAATVLASGVEVLSVAAGVGSATAGLADCLP